MRRFPLLLEIRCFGLGNSAASKFRWFWFEAVETTGGEFRQSSGMTCPSSSMAEQRTFNLSIPGHPQFYGSGEFNPKSSHVVAPRNTKNFFR